MPSSAADADQNTRAQIDSHNVDSLAKQIADFASLGGENHHRAALAYLRANGGSDHTVSLPIFYKSFTFDDGTHCVSTLYQPFLDAIPKAFATPPQALTPKAYHIVESPLGGVGISATRDIPSGVPIIVEHPCMLVPLMVPTGPRLFKIENDVIGCNERGFDGPTPYLLSKLPAQQVDEFLKLTNCHPLGVCSHEEGIFRTNGVAVDLPMKVPKGEPKPFDHHTALFLKISRCNHSCGPNATCHWNAKSFKMTLYSTRRIAAGEEITIGYTELEVSRAERQDFLKKAYSFDCKCPQCSLPSAAAVAKSDARRREIAEFNVLQNPVFAQRAKSPLSEPDRLMAQLERFIKITDKERLYCPTRYTCAVMLLDISAVLEDEERYQYWGKMCLSAFLPVACETDLKKGVARSEVTEATAKLFIELMASAPGRLDKNWVKRRMIIKQALIV